MTDKDLIRRDELLADRATQGLDRDEARELELLGGESDDSFDLAAAAADLATLTIEPMPDLVARRVVAKLSRPRRSVTWAPWVAAAAGIVLAIFAWLWNAQRAPHVVGSPTVAERRAHLLANAKDAETLAWTATPDEAARGASGDVIWSASAQEGYMRFVGLAPNDRTKHQYQLWIFDGERDDKFPVDGGVFDVDSNGEVIVPISPKLHVGSLKMFAVTVEQPGGVVVSKRERIVVLAKHS